MSGTGSPDRPGPTHAEGWGNGRGSRKRKWTGQPGATEHVDRQPHPGHREPPAAREPQVNRPWQNGPRPAESHHDRRGHEPRQEPHREPRHESHRWTQPLRHHNPPPPPPWRREQPPPGSYEPGSRGYERYDTGGYPRGTRHRYEHEGGTPPPPHGPDEPPTAANGNGPRMPKKLTVTRVAALRGRQLTGQAVDAFHRATKADGADKSGLTALTYSTMINYASDAAMAVALANTLFFSAASAESRGKVALYLLITIAPFALIAPVIGPALDRIQRGRRLAMGVASLGQALMCMVMALHFDSWLLYPAALGKMVLSKSFMVLKSSVTPRVVPPDITLSKTNARLTVFGLAAGGVAGLFASGFSWMSGSSGALWFTAVICVAGAVQAVRIPSWVEYTEGEVPASLATMPVRKKRERTPMGRNVVVALWGNGTIRVLTGFLMLFAAFAVKAATENDKSPMTQLLLLGVIGGAAGIGGFLGNALGSRMHFGHPDQVIVGAVAGTLVTTVIATLLEGVATAALVGLVGATGSALAKISLDAIIQEDLPEESRASAFGRSETVLQLSWCFGGAVGLLLPPTYWIGFLVVSVLLAIGLAQTILIRKGKTMVPPIARKRPAAPSPQRARP